MSRCCNAAHRFSTPAPALSGQRIPLPSDRHLIERSQVFQTYAVVQPFAAFCDVNFASILQTRQSNKTTSRASLVAFIPAISVIRQGSFRAACNTHIRPMQRNYGIRLSKSSCPFLFLVPTKPEGFRHRCSCIFGNTSLRPSLASDRPSAFT
jgi:hypothetical protein